MFVAAFAEYFAGIFVADGLDVSGVGLLDSGGFGEDRTDVESVDRPMSMLSAMPWRKPGKNRGPTIYRLAWIGAATSSTTSSA